MSLDRFKYLEFLSMKPMNLCLFFSCIFVALSIFILLYMRKRMPRFLRYGIYFCAIISVSGVIYILNQLEPYRPIYSAMNPAVRDRKPASLSYEYYSYQDIEAFRTYYMVSSLRKNSLYEEKEKEIPLNFIGKNKRGEYVFEKDHQKFFAINGVTETDRSDCVMIIADFYLKDPAFQEVGFFDHRGSYFIGVEVPKKDASKTTPIDDRIEVLKNHFHTLIY